MKEKILRLMIGLCVVSINLMAHDTIYYQGNTFLRRDIVYKQTDSRPLTLSYIYPEEYITGTNLPTIIFFFGGGWNNGSPDKFLQQALFLSRKGMISVLADYRTKNRDGVIPSVCVSDAKSAMRYLKSHATEFGVDTCRIVASGGSAGGHLAVATAVIKSFDDSQDDLSISSVPSALVLFNPVIDNGPVGGYGYERVKDYYAEFSPAHNIKSHMPPTLIMIGNRDHLIPISTILRFQEEMTEKGNVCQVSIFSSQKHGFFNFRDNKENPYFELTMDTMVAFLKSLRFIDWDDRFK